MTNTNSEERTLEERIKFDYGLTTGKDHLVRFAYQGRSINTLVHITARGVVWWINEPDAGTMWASWERLNGNKSLGGIGRMLKTWPMYNDPDIMVKFVGDPVATIELIK